MKKMLFGVLLTLMVSPAIAQDREAHEVENVYYRLQHLSSKQTPDALVTDKAALDQYVGRHKQQLEDLDRAFVTDLCTNNAVYRADLNKLLKKKQQYDVDRHAVFHSAVEGLTAALGKTFNDAFRERVSKAPVGRMIDTDLSDSKTREKILSRACTYLGERS